MSTTYSVSYAYHYEDRPIGQGGTSGIRDIGRALDIFREQRVRARRALYGPSEGPPIPVPSIVSVSLWESPEGAPSKRIRSYRETI